MPTIKNYAVKRLNERLSFTWGHENPWYLTLRPLHPIAHLKNVFNSFSVNRYTSTFYHFTHSFQILFTYDNDDENNKGQYIKIYNAWYVPGTVLRSTLHAISASLNVTWYLCTTTVYLHVSSSFMTSTAPKIFTAVLQWFFNCVFVMSIKCHNPDK